MAFFRKKRKYTMDTAAATNALQNIFEACDRTPNVTPFDVMLKTSRPDNRLITVAIWVCVVSLALTLASPLTLSQTELTDYYNDDTYLYLDCSGRTLVPEECTMVGDSGREYTYVSFNSRSNTISFEIPEEKAIITLVFCNEKTIRLMYDPKED